MRKDSSYRPEYGEQLVEASLRGYSTVGFAGTIGVSRPTLHYWAHQFPEFADAMARAKAARALWLEDRMRDILVEGGTGGQAQLLTFLLKNAAPDDYRDRRELTGAEGKPLIEDADPARIAKTIIDMLKGEEAASS